MRSLYTGDSAIQLMRDPSTRGSGKPHITHLRNLLYAAQEACSEDAPDSSQTIREAAGLAASMARELRRVARQIDEARELGNPLEGA